MPLVANAADKPNALTLAWPGISNKVAWLQRNELPIGPQARHSPHTYSNTLRLATRVHGGSLV